jgi:hypothetical protein
VHDYSLLAIAVTKSEFGADVTVQLEASQDSYVDVLALHVTQVLLLIENHLYNTSQ